MRKVVAFSVLALSIGIFGCSGWKSAVVVGVNTQTQKSAYAEPVILKAEYRLEKDWDSPHPQLKMDAPASKEKTTGSPATPVKKETDTAAASKK